VLDYLGYALDILVLPDALFVELQRVETLELDGIQSVMLDILEQSGLVDLLLSLTTVILAPHHQIGHCLHQGTEVGWLVSVPHLLSF
jgi:hypothetical protein